jgi:hypothetical protein
MRRWCGSSCDPSGTAGNLGSDAHLAALAIEYGAELNSCHSDVSRSTSAG